MSDIQTAIDALHRAGMLESLLRDRTTGKVIQWGPGEPMAILEIVGPEPPRPIQPRWQKAKAAQEARTRKRAEVFTPSRIVNQMVDALEQENPKLADWRVYLEDTFLEITCGEGAFLTTRYEMETGEPIPEPKRVGILDRKLRLLREHLSEVGERPSTADVMRTVYGYEYQGDSLLIARINVLLTIAEHIRLLTGRPINRYEAIAAISDTTYNLWQMDGLTGCIPGTDTPARIMDWRNGREDMFPIPDATPKKKKNK